MEQINRFVMLARSGRFTLTDLCEQFGISRKTGYKYLARYEAEGLNELRQRSHRPRQFANATDAKVEALDTGGTPRAPHLGAQEALQGVGSKTQRSYGVRLEWRLVSTRDFGSFGSGPMGSESKKGVEKRVRLWGLGSTLFSSPKPCLADAARDSPFDSLHAGYLGVSVRSAIDWLRWFATSTLQQALPSTAPIFRHAPARPPTFPVSLAVPQPTSTTDLLARISVRLSHSICF